MNSLETQYRMQNVRYNHHLLVQRGNIWLFSPPLSYRKWPRETILLLDNTRGKLWVTRGSCAVPFLCFIFVSMCSTPARCSYVYIATSRSEKWSHLFPTKSRFISVPKYVIYVAHYPTWSRIPMNYGCIRRMAFGTIRDWESCRCSSVKLVNQSPGRPVQGVKRFSALEAGLWLSSLTVSCTKGNQWVTRPSWKQINLVHLYKNYKSPLPLVQFPYFNIITHFRFHDNTFLNLNRKYTGVFYS